MGLAVQNFGAVPEQPESTVPEPATVGRFATGLPGIGLVALRRRIA